MNEASRRLSYEGNPDPDASVRDSIGSIAAGMCLVAGIIVLLVAGSSELIALSQRIPSPWMKDRPLFLWTHLDMLITLMLATLSVIGGLLWMVNRRAGRMVLLGYAGVGIVWTIVWLVMTFNFAPEMTRYAPELASVGHFNYYVTAGIAIAWGAIIASAMLLSRPSGVPA